MRTARYGREQRDVRAQLSLLVQMHVVQFPSRAWSGPLGAIAEADKTGRSDLNARSCAVDGRAADGANVRL